jgi:hypothetical protein
MQYQQPYQPEYAPYPAQVPPQQYYEAPMQGYGGEGIAGYQEYAAAPMQGLPPGQQVQYVQSAPQAGGYYVEAAPQFQQQQQFIGGAPALIQGQPTQMAQSPQAMAQQPQYTSAPHPAFQQQLGNGGKGKLIKAGR